MTPKKKGDGLNGWEFRNAFPTVADAVLIYEEFDFTGPILAGVHSVRRRGHIMACSNPRCHDGGYDLRPEIAMVLTRMNRLSCDVHLQCNGWETKPKRSTANICTGSIEGHTGFEVEKHALWPSTMNARLFE